MEPISELVAEYVEHSYEAAVEAEQPEMAALWAQALGGLQEPSAA